jgi:hypothetical protein
MMQEDTRYFWQIIAHNANGSRRGHGFATHDGVELRLRLRIRLRPALEAGRPSARIVEQTMPRLPPAFAVIERQTVHVHADEAVGARAVEET